MAGRKIFLYIFPFSCIIIPLLSTGRNGRTEVGEMRVEEMGGRRRKKEAEAEQKGAKGVGKRTPKRAGYFIGAVHFITTHHTTE